MSSAVDHGTWLDGSQDVHRHALARALRVQRAIVGGDTATAQQAIDELLGFVSGELSAQLHSVECELLPAMVRFGCIDDADIGMIAIAHATIRADTSRLEETPDDLEIAKHTATTIADHVRWTERELHPRLLSRLAAIDGDEIDRVLYPLRAAEPAFLPPLDAPGAATVSIGSFDATSVRLAPGKAVEEAAIDRDVVYVVTDGDALLFSMHGEELATTSMKPGHVVVLARGTRRRFIAGSDGLQFTSVHVRRGTLSVRRAGSNA